MRSPLWGAQYMPKGLKDVPFSPLGIYCLPRQRGPFGHILRPRRGISFLRSPSGHILRGLPLRGKLPQRGNDEGALYMPKGAQRATFSCPPGPKGALLTLWAYIASLLGKAKRRVLSACPSGLSGNIYPKGAPIYYPGGALQISNICPPLGPFGQRGPSLWAPEGPLCSLPRRGKSKAGRNI